MTHSYESQQEFKRECEALAIRAIQALDVDVGHGFDPHRTEIKVNAGMLIRLLKRHVTIEVGPAAGTVKTETNQGKQ